jgi:pilus assembly protein CpaB
MNRRVAGIIMAVLLGIVGTVVLVRYVQSARDDAAAAEPTSTVLVVVDTIAQGSSLDEISARVEATEVPDRLVAAGALEDLDTLDQDLVAGTALQPGEQLLRSRLVSPEALVSVEVPAGLQQLTIALDPERAVGGQIEAGSTIGIVISFEPFELNVSGTPSAEPLDPAAPQDEDPPTKTPNTTHLTLNQILVTSLQLSRGDAERSTAVRSGETNDDTVVIAADIAEAPGDRLLVTLAVTAAEAEQIVFAAEFGRIWLTAQNAATDDAGARILTLDQAYVGVPR